MRTIINRALLFTVTLTLALGLILREMSTAGRVMLGIALAMTIAVIAHCVYRWFHNRDDSPMAIGVVAIAMTLGLSGLLRSPLWVTVVAIVLIVTIMLFTWLFVPPVSLKKKRGSLALTAAMVLAVIAATVGSLWAAHPGAVFADGLPSYLNNGKQVEVKFNPASLDQPLVGDGTNIAAPPVLQDGRGYVTSWKNYLDRVNALPKQARQNTIDNVNTWAHVTQQRFKDEPAKWFPDWKEIAELAKLPGEYRVILKANAKRTDKEARDAVRPVLKGLADTLPVVTLKGNSFMNTSCNGGDCSKTPSPAQQFVDANGQIRVVLTKPVKGKDGKYSDKPNIEAASQGVGLGCECGNGFLGSMQVSPEGLQRNFSYQPPIGNGSYTPPKKTTTTKITTTTKTTTSTRTTTSTPSTTKSTPSTSTSTSTSSSTPSSSSSTPSSSTPSSSTKPKDSEPSKYPHESDAPKTTTTGPAATPTSPSNPAGTTTPSAPITSDHTAPGATTTESGDQTTESLPSNQAPPTNAPGTGDVIPSETATPIPPVVPSPEDTPAPTTQQPAVPDPTTQQPAVPDPTTQDVPPVTSDVPATTDTPAATTEAPVHLSSSSKPLNGSTAFCVVALVAMLIGAGGALWERRAGKKKNKGIHAR